jgi:hypothetical protein
MRDIGSVWMRDKTFKKRINLNYRRISIFQGVVGKEEGERRRR